MKKIFFVLTLLYLPFQLRLERCLPFAPMNFFLLVMLCFLLASGNKKFRPPSFEPPLIAFLVAWFVSFIYAVIFTDGMWRTEILQEFKRLFTLPLFYFAFSRCLKDKKEVSYYLNAFLVIFVLVGFHTMRNGVLGGANFADHKRSSGPFGSSWTASDIAGGFIATLLPFLFSYFLFEKRKIPKLLSAGGIIFCLLGLLATYSRGSMMAALFATFFTLVISLPSLMKRSGMYGFLAVLIIVVGAATWKMWVPQSTVTRFQDTVVEGNFDSVTSTEDLDESSQLRINAWQRGLELFKERPLTGWGFRQVQFQLGHDPHNAFIQILAEMGGGGFLIFVIFILSFIPAGLQLMKTDFVSLGVGMLGLVVSFVTVNLFYANFFRDAVVGSLWIILGIAAAASNCQESPEEKPDKKKSPLIRRPRGAR